MIFRDLAATVGGTPTVELERLARGLPGRVPYGLGKGGLMLRIAFLPLTVALLAAAACVTAARGPSPGLHPAGELGVARIWHGRTPLAKADEYEKYLYAEGIAKIRTLPGSLGAQVFRRDEGDFADFVVISYWPSREAVKQWAGSEIEKARYMARDIDFLVELEPTVKHYDVIVAEGRATR